MPTYREDLHLGHKTTLVETDDLMDKGITTDKLDDAAVTTPKIDDKAITTPKLDDKSVTTPKLGNASVTTPKIADESVTTPKLDDASVTTPKIADKNVTWDKLDDDLQNVIASRKEGGVALSNQLGNSEKIGITQKKLTEEITDIKSQVGSIADEEDLTVVKKAGLTKQVELKLKDKAYDPDVHSGMGRKYLRKNNVVVGGIPFMGIVENVNAAEGDEEEIIDEVFFDRVRERFVGAIVSLDPATQTKSYSFLMQWEDYGTMAYSLYVPISSSRMYDLNGVPYKWSGSDLVVYDGADRGEKVKNVLTQVMLQDADGHNLENTIFHIQYDYTLDGESIEVPAGSILLFEGGSISSGTITGDFTVVKAIGTEVFHNVTFDGNVESIDKEVADLKAMDNDLSGRITEEANRAMGSETNIQQGIGALDSRLQQVEGLAELSVEGGQIGIASATDFTNRTTEGDLKIPTVGAILNAADEEPTAGSTNLVKSGGVHNELALGAVYDVSAKNPTAGPNNDGKWESLSALLSDANLNTFIPTAVRKGGMSIKFVQSSDNKYVQYRLLADAWSTTESDWQGVDDEPMAGSENLVKSGGVADKLIKHDEWIYGKGNIKVAYEGTVVLDKTRVRADFDANGVSKVGVKSGYSYVLSGKVNESDSWQSIILNWTTNDTILSQYNYNYYLIRVKNASDTKIAAEELDTIVSLYFNDSYESITKQLIEEEVGNDIKSLDASINDLNNWKDGSISLSDYTLTDSNTRATKEFNNPGQAKLSVKDGFLYYLGAKVDISDAWTYVQGTWTSNSFNFTPLNYNYYKVFVKKQDESSLVGVDMSGVVSIVYDSSFPKEVDSRIAYGLAPLDDINKWKAVYTFLYDYTLVSAKTRAEFLLNFRPYTIKIKDGYRFILQGRNAETDSWTYIQGNWNVGIGEYLVPTPEYNYYKITVRNVADTSLANDNLSNVIRIRYIDTLLSDVLNIEGHPVYVDPNGDDNNSGTYVSPLKSIQIAINTGKPVVLKDGIYFVNKALDLSLVDKVSIMPDDGANPVIMAGMVISTADGSLYSGSTKVYSLSVGTSFNYSTLHWIYQYGVNDDATEILAEDRTAYHRRKTYRCGFTAITKVSSIDAVESSDGYAFYYENGTLYYSRPVEVSSSLFLFRPQINNLFASTKYKIVELTGLKIYGATVNIKSAFPSTLTSCSVYASKNGAGFFIEKSLGVRLIDCEAARIENGASSDTGDGFNMHTSNTTLDEHGKYTSFVMENCWSHDNWNDGYSDHEGCEGYINGGLFEFNCIGGQGGGITPAYGAHDVICNAIVQKNKSVGLRYTSTGGTHSYASITVNGVVSRNNAGSGFLMTESVDYADFVNCVAYGNSSYGFYAGSNSKVRCINCKAVNNTSGQFSDNIEII